MDIEAQIAIESAIMVLSEATYTEPDEIIDDLIGLCFDEEEAGDLKYWLAHYET